ncbi:hypothetical protein [uncultured Fibrobacter sp.]|jgi:hypothetical protein|nr:hypothetical protein [uncultured Fibrobacter sp.]
MKNEQIKKEYSAPDMEIVELKHQTNLMSVSCIPGVNCPDPTEYKGGFAN